MKLRAPEGAGTGGNGAGAGEDGAGSGEDVSAPAWHEAIKDEGLKGVASGYKTAEEFFTAVGHKPSAGPWYGEVDDELKKVADRFTSPTDALRSIQDLRKRESQPRVPGKNASEEDRKAYHKAIGVPETVEGYEFPAVPDDQMTDAIKESRAGWAKAFHELGISKTAAKTLTDRLVAEQASELASQVEADKAYAATTQAALDKDWGADKTRNMEYANRAFDQLASRAGLTVEELRQIETKDGRFLMDRPEMLKIFAVMGRAMGEGDLGGLVGADERQTVQEQVSGLRKKVEEAQASGNTREANRLYQQEQALLARLGNQPVVGSSGRAA